MDDELSSLKLKLFLLSYAGTYQRQDQQQLPAEEKKGGILTGLSTYASGLNIRRNFYGGTIKTVEFSESMRESKQFLERQYNKEGDKNTLPRSRQTVLIYMLSPQINRDHRATNI